MKLNRKEREPIMYILHNIENELEFINLIGRGGDFYLKDGELAISRKVGMLRIVDLRNAMKPGKTVDVITFSSPNWDELVSGQWPAVVILKNFAKRIGKPLREAVKEMKPRNLLWLIDTDETESILPERWRAQFIKEKSIRVYSPFAQTRPQKLAPRMSAKAVVKAINAGQFKGAVNDFYNSIDDWSFDEYMNNRKIDMYDLACDIWESPKGWDVCTVKEDAVSLYQYSFRGVTLKRA